MNFVIQLMNNSDNVQSDISHILPSLLHQHPQCHTTTASVLVYINLQLTVYASHLIGSNFIVQMLFKNVC